MEICPDYWTKECCDCRLNPDQMPDCTTCSIYAGCSNCIYPARKFMYKSSCIIDHEKPLAENPADRHIYH